jgi:hypothetical protein
MSSDFRKVLTNHVRQLKKTIIRFNINIRIKLYLLNYRLEGCMGQGLVLWPWPDLAQGLVLGLVEHMMFGSRPGSYDSNQVLYRIFSALLGPSFFTTKRFVAVLTSCL